jgi:hypothetical protein
MSVVEEPDEPEVDCEYNIPLSMPRKLSDSRMFI